MTIYPNTDPGVVVGGGEDDLLPSGNVVVVLIAARIAVILFWLRLMSATQRKFFFFIIVITRYNLGGILAMEVLVAVLAGKGFGPIPTSHWVDGSLDEDDDHDVVVDDVEGHSHPLPQSEVTKVRSVTMMMDTSLFLAPKDGLYAGYCGGIPIPWCWYCRVAQNTPKVKNIGFPHFLRFLGYHRWDICKRNQNSAKIYRVSQKKRIIRFLTICALKSLYMIQIHQFKYTYDKIYTIG